MPAVMGEPGKKPEPKPAEVFVSYAHEDEALKGELLRHLASLRRQGLIAPWHDRNIRAGVEWNEEIRAQLEAADLILLLVSADFIDSDFCHDVEMTRALERHERGEASVVPVIARPCDWRSAPFAKLQVLPKDGKPVTNWVDRDDAWEDVVRGVRQALALPVAEEEPLSSQAAARDPRVEIAKSKHQMIMIVTAIAAVTTTVWRTANVPTSVLIAIVMLALLGIAGSVRHHVLRARYLHYVAAGAAGAAGSTAISATAWSGWGLLGGGLSSAISAFLNSVVIACVATSVGVGIVMSTEIAIEEFKDRVAPRPSSQQHSQQLELALPGTNASSLHTLGPVPDAGLDGGDAGKDNSDAGELSPEPTTETAQLPPLPITKFTGFDKDGAHRKVASAVKACRVPKGCCRGCGI
jgi:hypothetical protein